MRASGRINGCLPPKLNMGDYAGAPAYLGIQELLRRTRPQNRSRRSRRRRSHRHSASVAVQQGDAAVQRSSDIAWEANWPCLCLSRRCLWGFGCLIELRVQENYRGRTEGSKWNTSTGFRTLHCFHLRGNKTAAGECISSIVTARCPFPAINHLLNIGRTRRADQSRRGRSFSI